MHSVSNRIVAFSSILFNATTILLFFVCILTYIVDKRVAPCNLKIVSMQPATMNGIGKKVVFNPQADLTEYFHLNVKQVFLYLKMHHKRTSEIIWSRIVQRGDEKRFFNHVINNYRFFDIPDGTVVKFELRGCIFPYVGIVQDKLLGSTAMMVHYPN